MGQKQSLSHQKGMVFLIPVLYLSFRFLLACILLGLMLGWGRVRDMVSKKWKITELFG